MGASLSSTHAHVRAVVQGALRDALLDSAHACAQPRTHDDDGQSPLSHTEVLGALVCAQRVSGDGWQAAFAQQVSGALDARARAFNTDTLPRAGALYSGSMSVDAGRVQSLVADRLRDVDVRACFARVNRDGETAVTMADECRAVADAMATVEHELVAEVAASSTLQESAYYYLAIAGIGLAVLAALAAIVGGIVYATTRDTATAVAAAPTGAVGALSAAYNEGTHTTKPPSCGCSGASGASASASSSMLPSSAHSGRSASASRAEPIASSSPMLPEATLGATTTL